MWTNKHWSSAKTRGCVPLWRSNAMAPGAAARSWSRVPDERLTPVKTWVLRSGGRMDCFLLPDCLKDIHRWWLSAYIAFLHVHTHVHKHTPPHLWLLPGWLGYWPNRGTSWICSIRVVCVLQVITWPPDNTTSTHIHCLKSSVVLEQVAHLYLQRDRESVGENDGLGEMRSKRDLWVLIKSIVRSRETVHSPCDCCICRAFPNSN